jgi:gluconate 5-dehydrogenase
MQKMAKGIGLFDLKGRMALVTGSSQGIGHAIARGLAEAGASVVLNGRHQAKLDEAAAVFRRDGLDVRTSAFDVPAQASVAAAVDALERDAGPIDVLVNNAGIQRRSPFEQIPTETWLDVMNANINGVFYVTQAVGRHMLPRKRGKIINICSVTSELGRATIVPYATSKGGLRQMTRGLCAEWAKHNIQINGIAPGYIKTELNTALMEDEKFSAWVCARTPAGRWAEVEELMGTAIFLASGASDYVNGHLLYVDGGLSVSV